jgi:hypothetical protein
MQLNNPKSNNTIRKPRVKSNYNKVSNESRQKLVEMVRLILTLGLFTRLSS